MNYWKNKKVLVTGGAGFIGSHLVEELVENQADVTVVDDLSSGSEDNLSLVEREIYFIEEKTSLHFSFKDLSDYDVIMHVAAKVGGIDYNRKHQKEMFDNNLINSYIDYFKEVDKQLFVSSACVYPAKAPVPTKEKWGLVSAPEETVTGYGFAKRHNELFAQISHHVYQLPASIVRPYNCYGPRDHYDKDRSHVIPALIKKVFEEEGPLVVWGSGEQTRSFIYVDDLVEGMILAAEKDTECLPINLCSDEEVTIKKLAEMIIELSGVDKEIVFDRSKPDGHARRKGDTTRAKKLLGFEAKTKLKDGLKKTIDDYKRRFQ